MEKGAGAEDGRLTPHFSRFGIWAFSIGTSIGWGSFIITCSTYLSQAGILGTVLGLVLGMLVILIVNHNLIYMIEHAPGAGGIYSYTRKVRGYDTGFLLAWLLLLTYLAVLWANITSLPLFARRFLGTAFQFGYCYTVFHYEVYLGEALLSIAALGLMGMLCARSRRIPQYLMIAMAVIFMGSLLICTGFSFTGRLAGGCLDLAPLYLPDKGQLNQIVRIAVISPWAFIGFENVAHFSEEFDFPVRRIRGVLISSVLLTTTFYILMTLLSVSVYPARYDSWLSYIRDMNNLEGLEAVPAFYAVSVTMGSRGISLLMLSLLSVIVTSMIGNLTAISRLLYAFGRDHEWISGFGKLNRQGLPGSAVFVTVLCSALIPFLGRTAIGWIVDVTTLGATIIYGFLSDSVSRDARERGDLRERITGDAGVALMLGYAVLLLAPRLMSYEAMEAESYLLFALWSLLGLALFRLAVVKDRQNRYGRSVIVWVVLLLLMLTTVMLWENRETRHITDESMETIGTYYQRRLSDVGDAEADRRFLKAEGERIENANSVGTGVALSLFTAAVALMLSNYRLAQKRESELLTELGAAREFGMRDSLTGVKNKHAYIQWEERIDERIEAWEAEPFAVVICDINNLKEINDRFGHKRGDECIRRACAHICHVYAHSPVFRYGGDEFAVLLFGEDFRNRAQLLEAVREPENDRSGSGSGVAAGMAEYRREKDRTLSAVFEAADRAMYENKRRQKSRKTPA